MADFGRRRVLQAGLGLAVGVPILAARAQAQAAMSPVRGGTFVMAIDPEPAQLFNAIQNQYANTVVGGNLFDGLVSYDQNYNPQPVLATAWSVAPDGLSITLHLRQGVKWHDGQDFTSADVKYSVREVWKKVHPRARVTFAPVTDVETPDAYTAVLKLSRPAPVMMNSLNNAEAPIMPQHIYAGSDIHTNPYNLHPVGTGPFKFNKWIKGQYVELVRNPDYWDSGKPYLDRVIIRTIPDAASRAAALETGEIVYLPYAGVPFSDVARLKKNADLIFEPRGYSYNAQIYFIEFNLRRAPLNNVLVRRAIASAIDSKGLAETVWYGVTTAVDGPIPPSLARYFTEDKPHHPLDIQKANQLLDQAGLPRKSNGVRFSISLDLSPSADAFVPAGEYIRQNLQKVGIDLTPIASDPATYLKKIYTDYNFDAIIQGYSILSDPEMGITRVLWSKAGSPGVPYVNASSYASPAMDRIIASYQGELDPAKRAEDFGDLQRLELTDLPLLPVVNAPFFSFYNRKVHGLDINPDGARSSFANVWLSH